MPKNWLAGVVFAASLALHGCGSDDAQPAPVNGPKHARVVPDTHMPLSELPEECRGFEVVGLKESPGGDVLPNLCAPFDGTYNNPYAIRCVDADPSYATGWRGDEYCILPPPPSLGMQVHIGPNDYEDEAQYASFVLDPGEEVNAYYYIKGPNTEPRHYYRTNWRMRDGSHHMIVTMLNEDRADGWDPASERSRAELGLLGGTGFGGAQRPDSDRPQGTLDVPPENRGIGGLMREKQQFAFNLHHMNRFETAILREVWMNVWYMPDSEVTKPMQGMVLIGNPADVAIPDGVHRVLHYAATVYGRPRIIAMFGHRHANTDRFGVWIERKSGERISAYESFDYTDMPVYQYDSISQNPVPNVEQHVDGGHSGLLELSEGDTLHFVCDIKNRSGVTLSFANQLVTGEMCITFGSITGGGSLNLPMRVLD